MSRSQRSSKLMNSSGARMSSSGGRMNRFPVRTRCREPSFGSAGPHKHVSPCCPGRPAVAWRAGDTRLHWFPVGSLHRCRCLRLAVAVLWRCFQAGYRKVGAAARPDFITDARKPAAPRAAEPPYRSGDRGEDGTSATGTSSSDPTGRCRADRRRRPVSRVGAVAPVDGARSCNRGARDRAAQDQPGTNGPRQCGARRAA